MMKIIAFGASYSKQSINKQFAEFAASQFNDATIEVLDLNQYLLPLFTVDIEAELGSPAPVKAFLEKIDEADLLIISMAEHNGSYTVAFKNLFDWTSRLKMKLFEHKNILLLATSPGPRGAISVLEAAKNRFPIHGGHIVASFSLPNFESNFDRQRGIINTALKQEFDAMIELAKTKLQ